jgi:hypothetical protein
LSNVGDQASRQRRWIGLVVIIVFAGGLVAGTVLVTRDAGDAAVVVDERPLAVASVIDTAAEIPPSDLYLVELGQPIDEGVRIKADVFHGRSAGLPDGRVLVIYERRDGSGEHTTATGAVVVGPDGTVDAVTERPHRSLLPIRWDDGATFLRLYDSCFTWSADTPGSGFRSARCPSLTDTIQPRPLQRGQAWRHEPSGTDFVLLPADRSVTSTVGHEAIELWRVPADHRPAERLLTASGILLLDVSPDGETVLLRHDVCADDAELDCDSVLAVIEGGSVTALERGAFIRSAFLLPDSRSVVFTERHSTANKPYRDETFLTTLDDPDRQTSLYDATVEAIVGGDPVLMPLDECPVAVPCD